MVTTIKTSISIPKTLFDQAEILAQQLKISQSDLFKTAIENFIKNYQSQMPLDANSDGISGEINEEINEVYQDQTTPNEQSGSPYQDEKSAKQISAGRRVINQGDIYWVQLENPNEMKPGTPHPYVIIQENLFNHSRIDTVVACALTSNIKRVNNTPGNILLDVGEANLPKQSVVEVSKVSTVDKAALGEYIGSLTEQRVNQILAGMQFLQKSFFMR